VAKIGEIGDPASPVLRLLKDSGNADKTAEEEEETIGEPPEQIPNVQMTLIVYL
jgi:hypothetical protein